MHLDPHLFRLLSDWESEQVAFFLSRLPRQGSDGVRRELTVWTVAKSGSFSIKSL